MRGESWGDSGGSAGCRSGVRVECHVTSEGVVTWVVCE